MVPANIHAFLQNALELHQSGDLQGAEFQYCQVLSAEPKNFTALANVGLIALLKAQWQEAEAYLARALDIQPTASDLHFKLAIAFQQQNKAEQAVSAYQQVIALNPLFPEAYINLGILLKDLGEIDNAIACYEQALSLNPNLAEAYSNLALALSETGKIEEAIAACQQAIAIKPDFPGAYINLGCIFHTQNDLEDALNAYQKAITLEPNRAETYHNLGLVYHFLGRIEEAIISYQQALSLRENYPEAHFSLAIAYLLSGDYVNGWREYEWRLVAKNSLHPMTTHLERGLDLATCNQEILLMEEQGIGDIFQFLRYGKLLKSWFPVVSIAVREPLCQLIQMTGIFDNTYPWPFQDVVIDPDAKWLPILSLPGILEVSPDNPLIVDSYIQTDRDKSSYWHNQLKSSALTIGLNWQGDPLSERTGFQGRSFNLSEYEPLASLANVQFLSLQKGFGSEQLLTCSFKERFVKCQDEINETWDWMETAAIIQNCDLIITSDTSIAHLAGAMGKPTWILLKKVPDWRWGLEGEHCPWYPSVRLFRQTQDGNWAEVMERVKAALSRQILNAPG